MNSSNQLLNHGHTAIEDMVEVKPVVTTDGISIAVTLMNKRP